MEDTKGGSFLLCRCSRRRGESHDRECINVDDIPDAKLSQSQWYGLSCSLLALREKYGTTIVSVSIQRFGPPRAGTEHAVPNNSRVYVVDAKNLHRGWGYRYGITRATGGKIITGLIGRPAAEIARSTDNRGAAALKFATPSFAGIHDCLVKIIPNVFPAPIDEPRSLNLCNVCFFAGERIYRCSHSLYNYYE